MVKKHSDYFESFGSVYRCSDCGVGKVGIKWQGKGVVAWVCELCKHAFGQNVTKPDFCSDSQNIPNDEILKHQGYT